MTNDIFIFMRMTASYILLRIPILKPLCTDIVANQVRRFGTQTDNHCNESFNGSFLDKCPNMKCFRS